MKVKLLKAATILSDTNIPPPDIAGAYCFNFKDPNYLYSDTAKTSLVVQDSLVAAADSICRTLTLSNSTSAQQPVFKSNLGLYFDGTGQFLSGTLSGLTTYYPASVYASYSLALTDITESGGIALIRSTSSSLLQLLTYSTTTDRPARVTARKTDTTVSSINYIAATNNLYTQYVFGAEIPTTGDGVSMYVKDSLYSSLGSIILDTLVPEVFRIGAASSTGTRFVGYINKIVYVPSEITAQNRIDIVRWLQE